METKDGKEAVHAKTIKAWRTWLQRNSKTVKSVWLILYHQKSTVQSIRIHEAMEEALCFGWIDSKAKKRDDESFYLTFTPRNPKSKWSEINKARAAKLIREGAMTEQGRKLIDIAKENGKW
jgi:uncharacterized protein YdeI (YjbR/CyaY-like superfamily)